MTTTRVGGQAGDLLVGPAVTHPKAAAPAAGPAAKVVQGGIQFLHAAQDELHPPIRPAGQGIKNFGIEDEDTMDPVIAGQGVGEGGVVVATQVAAKPDKGRRGG